MAPIVVTLLVGLPLFFVFAALVGLTTDSWRHVRSTLLADYVVDTVLLTIGVTGCSVLVGTPLAWFTTNYKFPGASFFSWAVALPIALPAYISAHTYAHITGVTGPLFRAFRFLFGTQKAVEWSFDFMGLPGAVFVLTLSLYPYVYLSARAFFAGSLRSLVESARAYGHSDSRIFFRVALPVARPAILAGTSLVLMETLNEYGATSYYGVQSMVTGIYRSWFSLGDLDSALRLSAILLLGVFAILAIERITRGNRRYDHGQMAPQVALQPSGRAALVMTLSCVCVVSFGLLVPAAQLVAWVVQMIPNAVSPNTSGLLARSLAVAGAGAALCVLVSFPLSMSFRRGRGIVQRVTEEAISGGYAIPGAIVVVGILSAASTVEKLTSLFLIGSIVLLLYAYMVRYLAVVMKPLQSGLQKIPMSFDDAGLLSGRRFVTVFSRIHFPILRPTFAAAFFVVCIDLFKELPITLVLRPFNFGTLATKTFELAQQDRLEEAALPSLLILAMSLLPAVALSRRAVSVNRRRGVAHT